MPDKVQRSLVRTAALMFVFFFFTLLVQIVDVQPIGPNSSSVGFAALNKIFMRDSVSKLWYYLTTLLGYLSLLGAAFFGLLTVCQFLRIRSIKKLNMRLVSLCVFYVLMMAVYVLFEKVIINYRPLLMDGELEASYPSSHTMLGICVVGTAMLQLRFMLQDAQKLMLARAVCAVLIVLMVVGRLLSGVHWFTDILAAVLVSIALISLYQTLLACAEWKGYKTKRKIAVNFSLKPAKKQNKSK